MTKYLYQVVSANGCGGHGMPHRSLRAAKVAAAEVAKRFPDSVVEIERVLELPRGRCYWMMSRTRWVPWDALKDASVRKPAFVLGAP